jgi:hypothetical protein
VARLKIGSFPTLGSVIGSSWTRDPFRVVISQQKEYNYKYRKLDTSAVKQSVRNVMRAEIEKIKKKLEETTEFWDGEKPQFKSTTHVGSNFSLVAYAVALKNDTFGAQKWFWLNDGTSVRWAMMSPNFSPKTKPNTFSTRPGVEEYSQPLFVGPISFAYKNRLYKGHRPNIGTVKPQPGVKRRNWSKKIMSNMQYTFDVMLKPPVMNAMSKLNFELHGTPWKRVTISDMPSRERWQAEMANKLKMYNIEVAETLKSKIIDVGDAPAGKISILPARKKNSSGGWEYEPEVIGTQDEY